MAMQICGRHMRGPGHQGRSGVRLSPRLEGNEPRINIATREELTIVDLARQVASAFSFQGSVHADPSKSDGVAVKHMDSRRLRALGWTPRIGLEEGLRTTYDWFFSNAAS